MNIPEEVKEDLPEIVAETEPEAPQAAQPAAKKKLPPLWRNRDYMLLWTGQVVSVLGGGISGIAFALLVLAITNGDYAAAGFAGALGGLPYLIFSLPIGALIDRWNRKKVMILCDTGRALSAISIPVALYFNVLTVWQLFANAFIEGTLFVFFNIAEAASLSRVVIKEQLPQATAQNEAGFIATGLVGPPLGGVLFRISHLVPFIFDAVSYIASVVSLLFIKTEFQEKRTSTDRNLRREIGEGLNWLWGNKLIRFMAFLTGGSNFTSSALFLIIIVLSQNLLGHPRHEYRRDRAGTRVDFQHRVSRWHRGCGPGRANTEAFHVWPGYHRNNVDAGNHLPSLPLCTPHYRAGCPLRIPLYDLAYL